MLLSQLNNIKLIKFLINNIIKLWYIINVF